MYVCRLWNFRWYYHSVGLDVAMVVAFDLSGSTDVSKLFLQTISVNFKEKAMFSAH